MVWLAFAALLVGGATSLGALGGNTERVTRMWVRAEIAEDGSARITEVIDYDFGTGMDSRHGIYRDVPGLSILRSEARVRTTMDSAPVANQLTITDDWADDTHRIRIGDPHRTVTGVHRYRIQYTLPRVVRHGKLAWNAVGTGWKVELHHVEIHVVAPYDLGGTRCVRGAAGSRESCAVGRPEPGHLVAGLDTLGPGRGATLYASRSGKALAAEAPAPAPPSGAATAVEDAGPGLPGLLAAAITSLAAAAAALLLRFAGRERLATDTPADGGKGDGKARGERRVDSGRLASSLTPASSPPEDLTPAQGGILLTEQVRNEHKVAWLMDLAAGGHLSIGGGSRPLLVRRRSADARLDQDDKRVLNQMFGGGPVTLGGYNSHFARAWQRLDERLLAWREDSGLWDASADRRCHVARRAGAVVALLGLALAVTGGVLSDDGGAAWRYTLTAGAVVAGCGLAMVVRGWELRIRTARGTALWMRVESFRRFLAAPGADGPAGTADHRQLERYTAWAVALGELDHWSRVVDTTATAPPPRGAGRSRTRAPLYGPLVALALVSAAKRSTTAPSSGGSGSGSGSGSGGGGSTSDGVGGGAGGGGGGSW
ncbi:DUF2207 domain-containing protein [Streptomyces sp. NPDC086766]|uniref:DUF2207 domain-containing protein n=1 Tax=Streptomyces sp. NPDC086766 TaxID=3365754 RepID=UPI00382DD2F2